jgi:hypothetical protein
VTEHDREVARTVARAELVKRVLIVVTTFLVIAVLGFVVAVLFAVRSTQQEGSPTIKALTAQGDRIEALAEDAKTAATESQALTAFLADCLNPEGACAKRGQQEEERNRQAIREITEYAVTCADQDGEQTSSEIRRCINEKIRDTPPTEETP